MKKQMYFILLMSFLLCKCNIDNTPKTYIYTSKNTPKLSLFIDDKYTGVCPYIQNVDFSSVETSKTLLLKLKLGHHIVIAKDTLGNIVSKVELDITPHGTSSSSTGNNGNHSLTSNSLSGKALLCLY